MRTDTQRLDWILAALDSGNNEPIERLQAAYTLELRGRAAMDAAMGAKVIEPGEPMPVLTAIDLATAEIGRIRNVKGFSEERDDGYDEDDLACAGACYLLPHLAAEEWPWGLHTFKPSPDDRKKELTKGIALALCELDRLIRAERRRDEAEFDAAMDAGLPEADCAPREFKVGDRVRIARKVTEQPRWKNSWVSPEMDRAIGASGVIERISDYGVEVLGVQYKWPSSSLEHADD